MKRVVAPARPRVWPGAPLSFTFSLALQSRDARVRSTRAHHGVSEHPMFARFYDRMTAGTERAGLGEMRRGLLSSASGRVLELGAGTGHKLPYYTDAVSELVMTEPDPHMARRLRERLADEAAAAGNPTVVEAP